MAHLVVHQCRVHADAFEGHRGADKNGKALAPVGAHLDASKIKDGLLAGLIGRGAVLSERDSKIELEKQARDLAVQKAARLGVDGDVVGQLEELTLRADMAEEESLELKAELAELKGQARPKGHAKKGGS